MTQAMDDRMTKAQEYLRHQGSKSLDELLRRAVTQDLLLTARRLVQ